MIILNMLTSTFLKRENLMLSKPNPLALPSSLQQEQNVLQPFDPSPTKVLPLLTPPHTPGRQHPTSTPLHTHQRQLCDASPPKT
jgi:hypothetical protein